MLRSHIGRLHRGRQPDASIQRSRVNRQAISLLTLLCCRQLPPRSPTPHLLRSSKSAWTGLSAAWPAAMLADTTGDLSPWADPDPDPDLLNPTLTLTGTSTVSHHNT